METDSETTRLLKLPIELHLIILEHLVISETIYVHHTNPPADSGLQQLSRIEKRDTTNTLHSLPQICSVLQQDAVL